MILVIDILPASGSVFTHGVQSSIGRRVDCDLSPGRRNTEFLDPLPIFGRKPSPILPLIFESLLGSSKTQYSSFLQPLDSCHLADRSSEEPDRSSEERELLLNVAGALSSIF